MLRSYLQAIALFKVHGSEHTPNLKTYRVFDTEGHISILFGYGSLSSLCNAYKIKYLVKDARKMNLQEF